MFERTETYHIGLARAQPPSIVFAEKNTEHLCKALHCIATQRLNCASLKNKNYLSRSAYALKKALGLMFVLANQMSLPTRQQGKHMLDTSTDITMLRKIFGTFGESDLMRGDSNYWVFARANKGEHP